MIEPFLVKKVLRAFENNDVGTINSIIIENKFNPNALIRGRGVSLLHLIIGHQSENFAFKITKLFLRCGGDPNVQSADGVTPTHVAAGWGRNKILHLLLINGGDPWIQDDENRNAFNYAFEEQEWSTISMLHHFQQMHSATNYRRVMDSQNVKFDLERVLFRRGDEMLAYAPIDNIKKSITTQTQSFTFKQTTPSPPIQEKIKYFEPSQNVSFDFNIWRKSDKLNMRQTKQVYQTSCEMLVHCNSVKESEDKTRKKESYISSVHLSMTPNEAPSIAVLPPEEDQQQTPEDSTSKGIRDKLFVELQEAVLRRSKQRIIHAEPNAKRSDSIVVIDSDSRYDEHSTSETKNCNFRGADSGGNRMLQNMSDFATKVMEEIQGASNQMTESTIDLCVSSPEPQNTYFSCEDQPNVSKKIQTIVIPQSTSESSTVYLTPYNSNLSSALSNDKSKEEVSNASFASVSEEYKYTDAEEGIVLLEKKLIVTPNISDVVRANTENCSELNSANDSASSVSSELTVPSNVSCNSDVLRCELMGLGYSPGPITKTTKRLYLKKLWKIKRDARKSKEAPNGLDHRPKAYSFVLHKTLSGSEEFEKIKEFRHLEEEMCLSFEKWTNRKWREGTNKTSFNYLLLDPRISSNLPKRALNLDPLDAWKCFLSSIFYVGKGKRSRPYAHLYQAVAFWQKKQGAHDDDKVERITDIWKDGLGVVCLQVFQNVIPVEAFTREAAMIDALGLPALRNAKLGEYYGIVSTWSLKDKRNLGVYLLHKALLIFLNEGERQIKPYDID